MKKLIREYVHMYDGENFNQKIIELASLLSRNKNLNIYFNIDSSSVYYEGDSPTYELVIDGFENDD